METLSLISFYTAMVCGWVGGSMLIFQIGRLGSVQIGYDVFEIIRVLNQKAGFDILKETGWHDADLIFFTLGRPKSWFDFLYSFTPFSWISTLATTVVIVYRYVALPSVLLAAVGGLLGRLCYSLGAPALLIQVILLKLGYDHWPAWLDELGPASTTITIGGGYLAFYLAGRALGSPQRSFNTARMDYERIVREIGYWFDHRDDADHSVGSAKRLAKCAAMYDRIQQAILSRMRGGPPRPRDT